MNQVLSARSTGAHTVRQQLAARRLGGLDGLRAIAVTLVVIYHLFPGILPGGLIGVDVFFVVSGYLITMLLLREIALRGTISLPRFWLRRSRRLLPALGLLMLVCTALAYFVGGDALVGLGRQTLGAVTFSSNWIAVIAGDSYFDATTPQLFRNLWSLAVEEQFYIVWPIVLLLCLPWIHRKPRMVALTLALAILSASLMAALASPEGDQTRVYFGTDTHSFGLMLGVMLALLLQRWPPEPAAHSLAARTVGPLIGVLGVAGIVVAAIKASEFDPAMYPGWLLLASVATVFAILGSAIPGSWLARLLDIAPMRWIGDRSYGIYLWHWPLFVLAITAFPLVPREGAPAMLLGAACLVLTIAAATLSHRFVETPIRVNGYRAFVRRLGAAFTRGGKSRIAFVATASVAVASGGLGLAAITVDPGISTAASVIEEGAATTPQPATLATAQPSPEPADVNAPPSGEIVPPTGAEITAVGDSVMLASIEELSIDFPGIQVDAAVSRQFSAGVDIVQSLADSGQLREFVVVGLGTNGPVDAEDVERLRQIVGEQRKLVLVDAFANRPWIPGVNETLTRFASTYRNIALADWTGAISGRLDLLAGDQIHPRTEGSFLYSEAVRVALLALTPIPKAGLGDPQ
ncbi:acyltransferase family protein [Humidisolicoccus flavus]|uniref:acyltransferase family protein n=1 Tax=Humidisolicoccus flavus TaxID=3111414 RepID=UPI00324E8F9A